MKTSKVEIEKIGKTPIRAHLCTVQKTKACATLKIMYKNILLT